MCRSRAFDIHGESLEGCVVPMPITGKRSRNVLEVSVTFAAGIAHCGDGVDVGNQHVHVGMDQEV